LIFRRRGVGREQRRRKLDAIVVGQLAGDPQHFATRDSSEAELLALAQPRLARLLREGVTTLEIKSGYNIAVGVALIFRRRGVGREQRRRKLDAIVVGQLAGRWPSRGWPACCVKG
jgi:imidazolonepropionase-like amidohydrolase